MFENVLGQEAAQRLSGDLSSDSLPPSILFYGPPASGKSTAALELARALSCDHRNAPWNCSCSSCERHRLLSHPDLLLIGPRSFSSELAAAASAFLRERESSARLLFLRAARKLAARFSPILWEGDEAKFSKAAALSAALGEDLEELGSSRTLPSGEGLKKLVDTAVSTALKLEDEGISDTIPIAQIRRMAYWARLAPTGKRKLILIENADRMQEGARNALLKILEEPPATTVIVLATARRGAIMPTIASRLRPYAFSRRSPEIEREVVRRVFRDRPEASDAAGGLAGYLESFLPVPPSRLDEAAASFLSGRDSRSAAAAAMALAGKFEPRSLFPSFLERLLAHVSPARNGGSPDFRAVASAEAVSRAVGRAHQAVGTYNQSPALALERLFAEIKAAGGEVLR